MATHIKFISSSCFEDEERADEMMGYIHCMNSTFQGEHTLCGTAFDGDGFSDELTFIEVKDKITCPDCIKQINFCKSIKASEIEK